MDESINRQIGYLAQKLHTTQKAIIEAAIPAYTGKTQPGEKGQKSMDVCVGLWLISVLEKHLYNLPDLVPAGPV